jgi:hypothetical protein
MKGKRPKRELTAADFPVATGQAGRVKNVNHLVTIREPAASPLSSAQLRRQGFVLPFTQITTNFHCSSSLPFSIIP